METTSPWTVNKIRYTAALAVEELPDRLLKGGRLGGEATALSEVEGS
jgi:hypothetical protein